MDIDQAIIKELRSKQAMGSYYLGMKVRKFPMNVKNVIEIN